MRHVIFATVLLAGGTAWADDFVTLDRQDRHSFAGLEATFFSIGNSDNDAFRFDFHGQFMDPSQKFGGYLTLPATIITGDNGTSGLGDLEVGGIYALPRQDPGFDLIFHAGITLPTGSRGDGGLGNLVGSFGRITDFYDAIPRGVSLRFGGSPVWHRGQLIARADVGLDVNLSNDDANTNADTFVRLNFGIGADLHSVSLMGEFTNIYDTNDNGGWIDTAAFAVRFKGAGKLRPYVALVLPLDDDASGVLDVAFTVGVDSRIDSR